MNFILNMLSSFTTDIHKYSEDKLRYIIKTKDFDMIIKNGLKEGFINDHYRL